MSDRVFFLGAASSDGYVSYFSEAYNRGAGGHYYILKGGAGTGKSTFMRTAAQSIKREGYEVEYITCSADPDSLDAVLFPELNAGIFDGTAPHIMEPGLPGVCEQIINLGEYWDTQRLRKNASRIAALTRENSRHHKKSADFLLVASRFAAETTRIVSRCTDYEKLEKYITRLCLREVKCSEKGNGILSKRLLGGITPKGIVTQTNTVLTGADKIISLEDEHAVCAPAIVSAVCEYALSRGYDATLCLCPLFPKERAEHLLIPELSLCIFTSNSYHKTPDREGRQTHCGRFTDLAALSTQRERLNFNKKAKAELIGEAVCCLSRAKAVHDELEVLYSSTMDFSAVNEKCKKTVSEILAGGQG